MRYKIELYDKTLKNGETVPWLRRVLIQNQHTAKSRQDGHDQERIDAAKAKRERKAAQRGYSHDAR